MLLAALVVGLLTAYVYGRRAGMWAAGATLALLVVAWMIPAVTLPVYAVIGVGTAATSSVAARRGPHVQAKKTVDAARALWRRYRS